MNLTLLDRYAHKSLRVVPGALKRKVTGMERRCELLPQMRDYDRLELKWMPYLMFQGSASFRSDSCCTDRHGFRMTSTGEEALDFDTFQSLRAHKGVVVGGSFAFGVGASRDALTIPSLLNQDSLVTWFNLAGRAFNSTQEVMLFQLYLPDVKEVLIISGLNNLIAYPFSSHFVQGVGSFCNEALFYQQEKASGSVRSAGRFLWDALQSRLKMGSNWRAKPIDHDERYGHMLEVIERDLEWWRMLKDQRKFRIRYFLQPFAGWVKKVLTREEEELFAILDVWGGSAWQRMSEYLIGRYECYRKDLMQLCDEKEIDFFNLNEGFPREGWFFCDRAHLTDQGNRQVVQMIQERVV
jgi:hypothetical protein